MDERDIFVVFYSWEESVVALSVKPNILILGERKKLSACETCPSLRGPNDTSLFIRSNVSSGTRNLYGKLKNEQLLKKKKIPK